MQTNWMLVQARRGEGGSGQATSDASTRMDTSSLWDALRRSSIEGARRFHPAKLMTFCWPTQPSLRPPHFPYLIPPSERTSLRPWSCGKLLL